MSNGERPSLDAKYRLAGGAQDLSLFAVAFLVPTYCIYFPFAVRSDTKTAFNDIEDSE